MKKINKEKLTEDLCFECKDGGLLRICDHRKCVKAYHPMCVGKDDSFLESSKYWVCGVHSCFVCHKASKFFCYCCPKGICRGCISGIHFAQVRGKNGFCNNCLKLALLVEEDRDVDSDGDMVNFKDRATSEFLFMEYWELVRGKEDLSIVDLQAADSLMKMDKNFKIRNHRGKPWIGQKEDLRMVSDDMNDYGSQSPGKRRKQSSLQKCMRKKSLKNKAQMEYVGWGSKPLIEFLSSISKDTSSKLSQYDISSIINKYIRDNGLLDLKRKKLVTCDFKLSSLFCKKRLNMNKIYGLLEPHFVDNLLKSEEDEVDNGSETQYRNENTTLVPSKRPMISRNNKVVMNRPKSCFAALIAHNFRLIYLKRSLILELLKQSDTFEEKVIGGLVRVKSDPNDYMQKNSHQLVQILGVKKKLDCEKDDSETLLRVTNVKTDISVGMLSDDQFREEECNDMSRRVDAGLLKRFTIVEMEQKARSLHEDIIKHWIKFELTWLQKRIDLANEKGWRRELFEYIERKRVLETPEERARLLQQIPEVIPDIVEKSLDEKASIKPMANEQKKSLEVSDSDDHRVMKTEMNDLIVLSDDGEENSNIDMKSCVWYCVGPLNDKKGPLSLGVLSDWNASSSFATNYKVWKKGGSEKDAVFFNEVIGSTPKKNIRR